MARVSRGVVLVLVFIGALILAVDSIAAPTVEVWGPPGNHANARPSGSAYCAEFFPGGDDHGAQPAWYWGPSAFYSTGESTGYCGARVYRKSDNTDVYGYVLSRATLERFASCADGTAPNMAAPLEQRCPDPVEPACQRLAGQGTSPHTWIGSTASGPDPFYSCDALTSCSVVSRDKDICFSYSANWACTYRTARWTGNSCDPDTPGDGSGEGNESPSETPPDLPERCPAGQAPGIVNGVQGCYPAGNQGPASSGTSTSENTTTSDGGNTTTTTQRTTTCEGGVCTTTTTTTVTNNITQQTTTETNTRTEPRSSFCQNNPRDSLCGGSGDGEGDGEAAPIGDLYAKKDDTFQAVLTRHRDGLLATGIGAAVGGFFTVSGGGTCPTYTANIPYIEASITFDQLCTSFASDALSIMRIAVLLVFGFFAFRIAVE